MSLHETANGIVIPDNTEQVVCSLSVTYPRIDVYVANIANSKNANGTLWKLYAVSGGIETLVAVGKFVDQGPQHVLVSTGSGATMTLKVTTDGLPCDANMQAVMFGWDPEEGTGSNAAMGTHTLGTNPFTFASMPNYHTLADLLVDASTQPSAVLNARWTMLATFPSVAGFPGVVIAAKTQTEAKQSVFESILCGCEIIACQGRTVGPNTGNVTVALIGRSLGQNQGSITPGGDIIITGLVNDLNLLTGQNINNINQPATDNSAVIALAIAAGQALGRPVNYIVPDSGAIPRGFYIATDFDFGALAFPFQWQGAGGDNGLADFGATRFGFPAFNALNGDETVTACWNFGSSADCTFKNITTWKLQGPIKYAPGMLIQNNHVVPTDGTFGYVAIAPTTLHSTDPNPANEVFLNIVDFDLDTFYPLNQELYAFPVDPIINPNTVGFRYQVTTQGKSASNFGSDNPFTGDAQPWQPLTVYAPGALVRPTDPNWTPRGSYFTTDAGLTSGAIEPNWAAHDNPGDTVPDGGGTWKNEGTKWGLTVGQTTASSGVIYTLIDTSGLLHDPNVGGGGGAFDWKIRQPCAAIEVRGNIFLYNCLFNFHEDGVRLFGDTSTPGDDWYMFGCAFINTANKCWYDKGGDANIGITDHCVFSQYGNCAIDDECFLGSSHYDHNFTTGGTFGRRFGAKRLELNGASLFSGNYTEGGGAPHWIRLPSTFQNAKGSPSFREGVPDVPTYGGSATPFNINVGIKGHQWAVGLKVIVGSRVYPDPENFFVYEAIATPGPGNQITLANPQPNFVGNAAVGATFVDGQGIQWTCLGGARALIQNGDEDIADANYGVTFERYGQSLGMFIADALFAGYVGLFAKAFNRQTVGYLIEFSTSRWWLAIPTYVGFTFPQTAWWWDSVFPTLAIYPKNWEAGARVWNDGKITSQELVDYWRCTVAGNPGTWVPVVPAISNGTLENPDIDWAGNLPGGSGTIADGHSTRDGEVVTNDATVTTAKTFSLATASRRYQVACEVVGVRTDAFGDTASFLVKGNYINTAGVVTADGGTPYILEGEPTDATHTTGTATAWRATLDINGTNVRVRVTGEAGKVIHWSVVSENITVQ